MPWMIWGDTLPLFHTVNKLLLLLLHALLSRFMRRTSQHTHGPAVCACSCGGLGNMAHVSSPTSGSPVRTLGATARCTCCADTCVLSPAAGIHGGPYLAQQALTQPSLGPPFLRPPDSAADWSSAIVAEESEPNAGSNLSSSSSKRWVGGWVQASGLSNTQGCRERQQRLHVLMLCCYLALLLQICGRLPATGYHLHNLCLLKVRCGTC